MKIISGGQTGVDIAALDASLDNKTPCGGCCPKGRIYEDGVIPAKYPLQEMTIKGYKVRTKQNIIDSDVTVIFYFNKPTGGTKLTIDLCKQLKKPFLLIDAQTLTKQDAIAKILKFIVGKNVVNVAGPRASSEPRGYDYVYSVLSSVLIALK